MQENPTRTYTLERLIPLDTRMKIRTLQRQLELQEMTTEFEQSHITI